MDREIGEIQDRQEGIRRARHVVGRDEVASLLEERPGPIGLGRFGGLDKVEGGRGHEEVTGRLVGDCVTDHRVRLGPERQAVLRLGPPRLALGVVEGPLVEADDRLPGELHHPLAELDRLGQDDLLLGGEEGDLADLPQVHPDRVVDPDHVGRECLDLVGGRLAELSSRRCLELPSRRLLEFLVVERGRSTGNECGRSGPVPLDHLPTGDDGVGGRRGEVGIGVGALLGDGDRDGAGTRGTSADCPGAGERDYGERRRSEAQRPSCDPIPP